MKVTTEKYIDSCENINKVHSFLRKMLEAPDYVGRSESIQRTFCPSEHNPEKVEYWRKDLASYCAEL